MAGIVSSIKELFAENKSVQEIILELKNQGYSEADINSAFKQVYLGEDSEKIKAPAVVENNSQVIKNSESFFEKFDSTKALLVIGILLIAIATIIVAWSSWSNVAPFVRVLYIALPMILLYAIAYFLQNKAIYQEIQKGLFATASFILPFALGTFFYQFDILSTRAASTDDNIILLIFFSAFVGLIYYAIIEFAFRQYFMSLMTLLAFWVSTISLFIYFDTSETAAIWISLLFSAIIFGLGYLFSIIKLSNNKTYVVLGALPVSILLPTATLLTINSESSSGNEANALILASFGIVYLLFAIALNYFYLQTKEKAFHVLKRLHEEYAPIMMLMPILFLSFTNQIFGMLLIGLSVIYILITAKINIKTLPYMGAIGLVAGVMVITGKYFKDSISWPIIILLIGFLSIGLGLLIKKLTKFRDQEENNNFLGLGEDSSAKGQSDQKKNGLVNLILIIVGIVVAVRVVASLIGFVL